MSMRMSSRRAKGCSHRALSNGRLVVNMGSELSVGWTRKSC